MALPPERSAPEPHASPSKLPSPRRLSPLAPGLHRRSPSGRIISAKLTVEHCKAALMAISSLAQASRVSSQEKRLLKRLLLKSDPELLEAVEVYIDDKGVDDLLAKLQEIAGTRLLDPDP